MSHAEDLIRVTLERDEARKEVIELKKIIDAADMSAQLVKLKDEIQLLSSRVAKIEGPCPTESEELFIVLEFRLLNSCCSSYSNNEICQTLSAVFNKTEIHAFVETKIIEYEESYEEKLGLSRSRLEKLARGVVSAGSMGNGNKSCKCGLFLFVQSTKTGDVNPTIKLHEYEVADLADLAEAIE